jgi:cyclopropane fatty-acyl-phospholipid synthase-like methyltransferase
VVGDHFLFGWPNAIPAVKFLRYRTPVRSENSLWLNAPGNRSKTYSMTADMNDFTTTHYFDRIVSVEMFEHMRNYEQLLARIRSWLKPQGKLFVHIFCHREFAYPFTTEGAAKLDGALFFHRRNNAV